MNSTILVLLVTIIVLQQCCEQAGAYGSHRRQRSFDLGGEDKDKEPDDKGDYIPPDPRINLTPSKKGRQMTTGGLINVEILLVVTAGCYTHPDYNKDEKRLIDYYRMLLFGANKLYMSVTDPRVKLVYSGIHFLKTPEDQPFLEKFKWGMWNHNGAKTSMFNAFKEWVEKEAHSLPKYDVAVLVTCENTVAMRGYSQIGGACFPWGASWIADIPGTYVSVPVLAHEIGHTLGAWHDGDLEQRFCPDIGGYLMNTVFGVGIHRNSWSNCTIEAIRKTVSTKEGSCLWRKDAATWVPDADWSMVNRWITASEALLPASCDQMLGHYQFGNTWPYVEKTCRMSTEGLP